MKTSNPRKKNVFISDQKKISSFFSKKIPFGKSSENNFTTINEKPPSIGLSSRRVGSVEEHDISSHLDDEDIIPVTPKAKLSRNKREWLLKSNCSTQDEDVIPPTPESEIRHRAVGTKVLAVSKSEKPLSKGSFRGSLLSPLSSKRKLMTNFNEEDSSIPVILENMCGSPNVQSRPDKLEEATKDLDDSSVKKRKVDKDCSSILESNVDAILPASLNLDSLGHSESHNHLNQEVFHQIVGEDVVFKDSLLDDLDFPDEDISNKVGSVVPPEPIDEIPVRNFGRHVVLKVVPRGPNEVELTLWSDLLEIERTCILKGFWAETRIKPKDIVNVLSDFDSEQKAIVEDGRNFIVVHPDYLVSSTAVVSMVFCRRKAVLNEWFRAQDSFNVHMMIGTLIHQLFQEVAVNNRRMPREEIEYRLKDVLKKNSNLKEMYKFKEELTEEQLWKELLEYVPTIDDWMQKYHTTKMASASDHRKPDNIRITGIRDIEENVWCPRFGIKGKVDITAEAQMRGSQRRDSSKTETRVLPLELKTGRPTFSIEHQSQVILYGMMLKDRHLDTYGGLLFYLKTGDMKEIPTNVKSEQGLIQVRNELVHHLVNPLDVDPTTILKGKNYRMAELPEPLGESRLCSKCPHLQTCSLLYQTRNPLEEKASPSYEALSEQSVIHLNKSDKDYFTHWLHLLFLESSLSRESTFQLKNIWTSTARHRERRGDCFSDMQLSVVQEQDYRIKGHHRFCRRAGHWNNDQSLTSIGLSLSQSVVVSVEEIKLLALSTGSIIDISDSFVTVSLDRDLYSKPELAKAIFRIDAYSSPISNVTCLSNLARLMSASPNCVRLRRLVIQRQPPSFKPGLSKDIAIKGRSILKGLNKLQQRAILRVLQAEDYALIKGMPGSGKTNAIVALIQILVLLGYSVLVTSHTHSAVDNVLQKLKNKGVNFLRLGNAARIHSSLKEHTEDYLLKDARTLDDISRVFDTPQVVAITCLGSGHPIFTQRKEFDFCIVDEATQLLQPACLGPLFHCKRFVLVGDPRQLSPVITSQEAKLKGMEECLFTRLSFPEATVELTEQYRMNEEIQKFPNALTYGGSLTCANSDIAKSTLELPKAVEMLSTLLPENERWWLEHVICSDLKKSVLFLNTDNLKASEAIDQHNRIYNEIECKLVITLVTVLIKVGVKVEQLGVICPYRNQVTHIKQRLRLHKQQQQQHDIQMPNNDSESIEVSTVDQYQGRDKDVVIISFVRSSNLDMPVGQNEILNDTRRINVAITRAKKKLIMIGSRKTLCRFPPLKVLLELVTNEQEVVLDSSCVINFPRS